MPNRSPKRDVAGLRTGNSPATETGALFSFLLAGKSIRGAILDGSALLRQTQEQQRLDQVEAFILGQALLACALMAAPLKGRDEIGLRIDCTGPVKGLIAEATASGEVRGYLKSLPIPRPEHFNSLEATESLLPLWGEGFLTVTRYLEEGRQPFSGSVKLQSGDIGAEVSRYYHSSEQIPTTLLLSLTPDEQGTIIAAGGVLLQALPGAEPGIFSLLQQRVTTLPPLGEALVKGQSASSWLLTHFSNHSPEILAEKQIILHCRCNEERMRRLLLHLALADLEDMRDNGPFPLQITCHFCNREYSFTQQQLAEICQEKEES